MRLHSRIAIVALAATACLSGVLDPGAGPRVLRVTPDTLRLPVGATVVLSVVVSDTAGVTLSDAQFTFLSTDVAVASVSPRGAVTAHAPGHATIVIESAGSAASVPVETGLVFAELAAGANHTCGLTPPSDLYCWGANDRGQLGVGDRTNRVVPARVPGTWSHVTAGEEHTCALDNAGSAWCWGRGSDGRLGTGSQATEDRPVAVTGGLAFQELRAGGRHKCGRTTQGVVYCWGANLSGQLGDGSTTSRATPVAVADTVALHDLTTGAAHTCALGPGDRAWCWGANDRGQLAVDTVATLPVTRPRPSADSLRFAMLRAGGTGFTCGVATDGALWCWGRGTEGQLGIGTAPVTQFTPAVVRNATGDTLRFAVIALGWAHACGTSPTGSLLCWGTSRLGLPDLYATSRPTQVLAAARPEPVAGFAHTCALLPDRRAVCWGGGQDGALGFGDVSSTDVPRPVALQLGDPPG